MLEQPGHDEPPTVSGPWAVRRQRASRTAPPLPQGARAVSALAHGSTACARINGGGGTRLRPYSPGLDLCRTRANATRPESASDRGRFAVGGLHATNRGIARLGDHAGRMQSVLAAACYRRRGYPRTAPTAEEPGRFCVVPQPSPIVSGIEASDAPTKWCIGLITYARPVEMREPQG